MSAATIWHLVVKDWYLNRIAALLTVLGSGLAVVLLMAPGKTAPGMGASLIFAILISVTFHLPLSSVLAERDHKTLTFLMSLPVSTGEYVASKILANLSLFLLPWLTILLGGSVASSRTDLPLAGNGFVPVVLLGMVVGFSFVLAFALITESGGWTVALIVSMLFVFGNLSTHLIPRIPGAPAVIASIALRGQAFGVTLAVEVALIFVLLGAAFLIQSRKRDFL